MSFEEGDLLYVLDDSSDPDWFKARCRGKEGLVPANFLHVNAVNPLHDACKRGNIDLLEECLLNRVPVNAEDRAGNTPLHWASHAGHLDCLQRLLGIDQVNVNVKNRAKDTPLHLAAWKGHSEAVKLLRGRGAKLDGMNDEGKTAEELASDAETKDELIKWKRSLSNKEAQISEYQVKDYAQSDNDDDDAN